MHVRIGILKEHGITILCGAHTVRSQIERLAASEQKEFVVSVHPESQALCAKSFARSRGIGRGGHFAQAQLSASPAAVDPRLLEL